MTLGFFIATTGFFAVGPASKSLFAGETIWGMSSLFAPGGSSTQTYGRARSMTFESLDAAPRSDAAPPPVKKTTHVAANRSTGRRFLCVRLCDGFAFPVGPYRGGSDAAKHESICQSTCPDADTALYILPAGKDKIEEAVSVETGRNYSELPDALHYTKVLDNACTCHKGGAGSGTTLSLLRDTTLRRGDAVMTNGGFKVFHGSRAFPYRSSDFVALADSRDVKKTDRATFGAIERASLKTAPGTQQNSANLLSDDKPTAAARLLHAARTHPRWTRQASRD